jgi:hypothetical protein
VGEFELAELDGLGRAKGVDEVLIRHCSRERAEPK